MKAEAFSVAVACALVLLVLVPQNASGTVPQLLTYQGTLTDTNGVPLNGIHLMNFYLYSVETGGSHLWTEQQSVAAGQGVFTAVLGSEEPFAGDEFDGATLYLEMEVFDPGAGWVTLEPRQKLTSTAFAMKAAVADSVMDGAIQTAHIANGAVTEDKIDDGATIGEIQDDDGVGSGLDADLLDGQHASEFSTVSHLHDTRYYTESESDAAFVDADGDTMSGSSSDRVLSVSNLGTGNGIEGSASGADARGVLGSATGTNGRGVYGYATATNGRGIQGTATGPSGQGVLGWAQGEPGYAVYGNASSTGEVVNYGGYFKAAGTQSRGVFGWALDTGTITNYGGYFKADGEKGVGVYGEASNTGPVAKYGGYFQAMGAGGIGVLARSDGPSGRAVWGWSPSQTSHAGWFDGDVHIGGYLNKAGGGFKIDHPLEPDGKYLNHSFVESPDMMNMYNGNVPLDHEGEAWVELPEWFEALNRDFRYQLTCIGGFAPVYIAEEIADNRFRIAGGEPGGKVSWQVTGIRQDPWANANRPLVEENKTDRELGYYLHPESCDQPEEKGIEWARDPATMKQMKEERERRRASTSRKPSR